MFLESKTWNIAFASIMFDLVCMDVPLISMQLFSSGLIDSKGNYTEGFKNV